MILYYIYIHVYMYACNTCLSGLHCAKIIVCLTCLITIMGRMRDVKCLDYRNKIKKRLLENEVADSLTKPVKDTAVCYFGVCVCHVLLVNFCSRHSGVNCNLSL